MRRALSRRLVAIAAAAALSIAAGPFGRAQQTGSDPFQFLAPSVVLSARDRAALDRQQVVSRVLPAGGGQLAVFVATRLNAPPDALIAWTHAIAAFKRSEFVLEIGRFSDPPRPSDLAGLTLDQRDLDAIRRCRPGDCGLKLSAEEIESLKGVLDRAGAGWREAVQQEFRRLLVERVLRYRAGGLSALGVSADRGTPGHPMDALSAIGEQSPYLTKLPHVVAWLKDDPRAAADVESFFYWSKEHYGEGKPVISITHVGIVRQTSDHQLPAVLVAGKQIFATHYFEAALGLTMVMADADGTAYLAYLNRSQVDTLRGFVGMFARGVLEGRLQRQAPQIVRGLRTRLESGNPPGASVSERRGIQR